MTLDNLYWKALRLYLGHVQLELLVSLLRILVLIIKGEDIALPIEVGLILKRPLDMYKWILNVNNYVLVLLCSQDRRTISIKHTLRHLVDVRLITVRAKLSGSCFFVIIWVKVVFGVSVNAHLRGTLVMLLDLIVIQVVDKFYRHVNIRFIKVYLMIFVCWFQCFIITLDLFIIWIAIGIILARSRLTFRLRLRWFRRLWWQWLLKR